MSKQELKYLILEDTLPVLFDAALGHNEAYRGPRKVTSAGLCRIYPEGASTYGESVTLQIRSDKNDGGFLDQLLKEEFKYVRCQHHLVIAHPGCLHKHLGHPNQHSAGKGRIRWENDTPQAQCFGEALSVQLKPDPSDHEEINWLLAPDHD